MKKITFGVTLIFLVLSGQMAAQKVLDKAADTSCKCIEEKFDKTKDLPYNESAVNNCIQQAFLSHIDGFSEEYGAEIMTDQKKAYKIGEELGLLIAKTCPTFIEFSMMLAKENQGAVTDNQAGSVQGELSGDVVRIEKNEFIHLIVKNADGRETDLIWLRYFEGSDQFKGNIESLKGKSINVSYVETEVYLPKMGDYFKVKEITGIETVTD